MRLHLKHCIKKLSCADWGCLLPDSGKLTLYVDKLLIYLSIWCVYIHTYRKCFGFLCMRCSRSFTPNCSAALWMKWCVSHWLANRRNCLHAGNVCTRIKLCSCMYSTRFPTYVFFFMLLVLYHMHSSVRSNIFNLVHQTLIVTCIAFNCNLTELQ